MSKTFEPCGHEVEAALASVIGRFRPELKAVGVKIRLLFATAADGPAITVGGHPAVAKVKINSLADRVEGKLDATITIDSDRWEALADKSREALLLHEVTHLELKRDRFGNLKTDDVGRPVLAMRPDDFAITGFDSVVRAYGKAALEADSIRKINERWAQQELFDMSA